MSRLRRSDIFVELIELTHEIMDEIRQQLVYYRASVYKDETSQLINTKIEQLRLVADLFGDDMVTEPLRDYDAMARSAALTYVPGECSYSKRITCLLRSLSDQLSNLSGRINNNPQDAMVGQDFTKTIQKHRRQLLALCRHGSRQWAFFQSL